MKKEFLHIEVRLLIQQYGERAVIQSLAEIKKTSIEEITALIVALESKKKQTSGSEKTKNDMETILKQITKHDNSELLIKLFNRFQNRTFLPQLKDVKRFLERLGMNVANLKSRTSSTKKLFDQLKVLRKEDLESISEDATSDGESTFSALADEIIGGQRSRLFDK